MSGTADVNGHGMDRPGPVVAAGLGPYTSKPTMQHDKPQQDNMDRSKRQKIAVASTAQVTWPMRTVELRPQLKTTLLADVGPAIVNTTASQSSGGSSRSGQPSLVPPTRASSLPSSTSGHPTMTVAAVTHNARQVPRAQGAPGQRAGAQQGQQPPAKKPRKKRRDVPVRRWLEVLEQVKPHGTLTQQQGAKLLGVTRAAVANRLHKDPDLSQIKALVATGRTNFFRHRAPQHPELEDKVYQWVQESKWPPEGTTTTERGRMLKEKAKEVALELNIKFTPSNSWASRFVKRKALKARLLNGATNQAPRVQRPVPTIMASLPVSSSPSSSRRQQTVMSMAGSSSSSVLPAMGRHSMDHRHGVPSASMIRQGVQDTNTGRAGGLLAQQQLQQQASGHDADRGTPVVMATISRNNKVIMGVRDEPHVSHPLAGPDMHQRITVVTTPKARPESLQQHSA